MADTSDRYAAQGPRPLRELLAEPTARRLAAHAQDLCCHIVGGVLRDFRLRRECRDWDLVVDTDGESFARHLAEFLPARFVPVGRDRFPAYRLIAEKVTIDLWDRHGTDLHQDLERRDFTINSMALDLQTGQVHDPFHGMDDLDDRMLRATTSRSFSLDPLRVLRLVRLEATLEDFQIVPSTRDLAAMSAAGIGHVASERTREELRLALRPSTLGPTLDLLHELRLYPGLWLLQPGVEAQTQPPRKSAELLFEFTETMSNLAGSAGPDVDPYLASQALLLACLPSDPARNHDPVRSMNRAGYLSNATSASLTRILAFDTLPTSTERLRWFLHETGELWPTTLCVSGARRGSDSATWGRVARQALHLAAEHGETIFDPPGLFSGDELAGLLDLPSGPELGRCLRFLKKLQVEGVVRDRERALELARAELSTWRSSDAD